MHRYLFAVLWTVIGSGHSLAFAEADELRAEVERVLHAYIAAEEAHDPDAIMNLISRRPGVTAISQGRLLTGRDAIERAIRLAAASQKFPKIALDSIAVRPLGNAHALAVAEYTLRVHLTQGPLETRYAWTLILEKFQDQWKIVHEHHSGR